MSETYEGDVYCVKCKDKRHVTDARIEQKDNGRRMAKGKCPECGTAVTKFLPKAS